MTEENGTVTTTDGGERNAPPADNAPERERTEAIAVEAQQQTQASAEEQGEADAGEGDESEGEGEATAEGQPGAEGAKRKRRRRRRKKGAGDTSAGQVAAEGATGEGAPEGAQPQAPREPKKEPHLPFARFFEGRDRGDRRHAFSVGEIVAGRVQRVEHGASVIDLFGKATAFALANEPREVPMPAPGTEPAETEESEEAASANLAQVGDAAAHFEGAVGMPASEALPEAPAPEGEEPVGPGPDGIWGTADDAPAPVEAERVAAAAHELSAMGGPQEEGHPPSASEAGGVEAPEEAAPEAPEEEAPLLEVGTIFRGRVAAVAESGHVAIHNKLATRAEARLKLAKAREEHRRVWGLVYGFNRGGFDVLVEGVRAFCPVSGMTTEHLEDPETQLGRRLEFSVQQAKSGHQGIVVSRRSILEKEARKRAKELRRSLQPGQRLKGRVTQVRDFGVFVDLGGVEGLVHMSELSWDRAVRPSDAARPGDEVEVQVLRVTEPQGRKDRDGRIALSLKALAADPWDVHLQGLEEGQARKGKVTRTAEFGAFVELAPGVEGLLHVTELGRDLKHANERIKEGEEVFVVVERLDKRARRISLSKMSDADARAFQEGQLETGGGGKVVRPGANLKVKVERVESGGLHVQVEGVLGRRGRGFIPNVEMATERGTDHRKKFPPGTELDVKVIGTDRDGGLRLSRKALQQDEERRAIQDYRKDAARKGFGTFGDLLKSKLGKR
ncbi:S1 RNA-binding domain-containing protein [Sandaracinus amylolyticus]|uniref:S1 RNA-binding domain-containing protein n=1 Tax=Sandaracinus amylolyticus TaxID=927083 RepID=UPI001EFFB0F9|nr:S1 RNA-binding domain-containing protein [Sandaracinus amylolyticus]UJR80385.1 SSU ribosomal protein S1p [Sandaracinus amylolyticus]